MRFCPTPFLALFLAAFAAEPARAESLKKNLQIPPGHSQLDDLQKEYAAASQDLLKEFEQLQAASPGCSASPKITPLLTKAVNWQRKQRETVLTALDNSAVETQDKIAKLDEAAAGANSGAATVAATKAVLETEIQKPKQVIDAEIPKVQAFSVKMLAAKNEAVSAFPGAGEECSKARESFGQKVPRLSLLVTAKLRKLSGALEDHRKELQSYASSVENALSNDKFGRIPASSP